MTYDQQDIITLEIFNQWKNDATTKALFAGLERIKADINGALQSREFVMKADLPIQAARFIGMRDAIDAVLTCTFTELLPDNDGEEQKNV